MGGPTRIDVTKHFVEFRIPNPCNVADMTKALETCCHYRMNQGLELSDDCIQVRAEDDEFVLWYEVPEGWAS